MILQRRLSASADHDTMVDKASMADHAELMSIVKNISSCQSDMNGFMKNFEWMNERMNRCQKFILPKWKIKEGSPTP